MDILALETEASKLRINLLKKNSDRGKLYHLYSFFDLILQHDSRNAVESYLLEFTSQYCGLISKASFRGVDPAVVNAVLAQVQRIKELYPEADRDIINNSVDILQKEYDNLVSILDGSNVNAPVKRMDLPLLEKGNISFEGDYGYLSTLNVKLAHRTDENKFHIIPGSGEPDAALKKQVDDSLSNALRIAGNYVKVRHLYWDVYIDFENKSGEYSGSSFGMLVVVKLVEELLRYYDSPVKIFSNSASALTGTVDDKGNIPSLSNDIIAQKTKTVFYSDTEVFIIPEDDLPQAKHTLSELGTLYPGRNLKLIGIQTVDDLLNLRNVVEIKKESGLLRTAKFFRKQAVSIILLIILAAVIIFSGLWDFDNNPDHFVYNGKIGLIKNVNGKVLFKTNLSIDYDNDLMRGLISQSGKIADINQDGKNEIILSTSYQLIGNMKSPVRGISCYDNNLNEIWNYSFTKKVSTILENHTDTYDIRIIDTLTVNDTLYLYCIAVNSPNETSAVFRVNTRDGSNTSSILWNSGHLEGGIIEDCNHNGQKELFVLGINNGLGRSVFFSIDINKIDGQLPALPEYRLLNTENAHPNQYLLLPKSDYTDYYGYRFNVPQVGPAFYDIKKNDFLLYVSEGSELSNWASIGYRFDPQLKLLSVVFSDAIIKKRDALIKEGKLKDPLTRTREFEQGLISQLRYWDGTRFVTAEKRFDTH